ncbi:MAG: hypothetical protein ACFFCW_08840 [Candidatus Hodarchaeota archaeon]
MKKFISLFLVFSILVLSIPLTAKEKKGADLIIQKTDGQQVSGELIAVKRASLLLLEHESGADVTVEIGDVTVITILKKSKFVLGASLGGLLGGVIGALATSSEATEVSGYLAVVEEVGESLSIFWTVVILGAIGFIVGGIIGAAAGTDKTIQLTGKSDSEIQEILEKLRKKARVKKAQ